MNFICPFTYQDIKETESKFFPKNENDLLPEITMYNITINGEKEVIGLCIRCFNQLQLERNIRNKHYESISIYPLSEKTNPKHLDFKTPVFYQYIKHLEGNSSLFEDKKRGLSFCFEKDKKLCKCMKFPSNEVVVVSKILSELQKDCPSIKHHYLSFIKEYSTKNNKEMKLTECEDPYVWGKLLFDDFSDLKRYTQRLKKEGLIDFTKDNYIKLTDKGSKEIQALIG